MSLLRMKLRKGAAGRRKSENENIRSLTKTGGGRTYTISLPVAVVREFGWKERQKLTLTVNRKSRTILIKDWPARAPRAGEK